MKNYLLGLFLLAAVFFSPKAASGQSWSGILQPTSSCSIGSNTQYWGCAISSWTTVGQTYNGGIPARTTIAQTINASACGSGSSDCAPTINTALTNCSNSTPGDTVLLGAGSFLINSTLVMKSNCTLRGNGANSTVIQCHSTSPTCVEFGNVSFFVPYDTNTAITGGATAGSNSITVASVSGISVGYLAVIEELNPSYVNINGGPGGGTCTGECGLYSSSMGGNVASRAIGQTVQVTGISGNTLTISPALYINYSGGSPQLHPFAPQVNSAGLENLQLVANGTTSGNGLTSQAMIGMFATENSWVKGIEDNFADANHVDIMEGWHDEIRDSYFSGSYLHTPGATDASVTLDVFSSASLLENNIVERTHVGIMLRNGASGNVIGYNYLLSQFDNGSPSFSIGALDYHSAQPQMNLLEGNITDSIQYDSTWGGSDSSTAFRNWMYGSSKVCNSISNGRQTVNCTPFGFNNGSNNSWQGFQAARGEIIDFPVLGSNSIANVIGSTQVGTTASPNLLSYSASPTMSIVPSILWFNGANRSYDAAWYGISVGFSGSADSGSYSQDSTTAGLTLLTHGDYYYANGTTNWHTGLTQTLPASFYLPSQPSWWVSGAPFPSIGPDVVGGTGPGGHVFSPTAGNAAQNCFASTMGGTDGSNGSPYAFNAQTCYGSGGGGTPSISFSPTSVNFGSAPLGTPPACPTNCTTITMSNPGSASLTWTGFITLGSPNPGDFRFDSNNCPSPGVLAPSGSCQMVVQFTPQAINTRSSAVTVSGTNISGNTYTVPLTGTGQTGAAPAPPTNVQVTIQ